MENKPKIWFARNECHTTISPCFLENNVFMFCVNMCIFKYVHIIFCVYLCLFIYVYSYVYMCMFSVYMCTLDVYMCILFYFCLILKFWNGVEKTICIYTTVFPDLLIDVLHVLYQTHSTPFIIIFKKCSLFLCCRRMILSTAKISYLYWLNKALIG